MIYTLLKNVSSNLRSRDSQYLLYGIDYGNLSTFIIGYILAIDQVTHSKVSDEFQEWLHVKVHVHFNLHWSAYILIEMAKNNEKKATILLLNLLDEFLDSKILEKNTE